MQHTQTARISALLVGSICLAGCQGAVWGNLAVLAASFGIFFGTLSLGRGR